MGCVRLELSNIFNKFHCVISFCFPGDGVLDEEQLARARWEAEALVLLVVVAGVDSHDHGID